MDNRECNAIPIINADVLNIIQTKEDGSCYVSFFDFLSMGNIVLNRTAMEIYDMCDGTNTINDIVDNIYREYADSVEDRKIIEDDTIDILKYFYNWNIISIDNDNPFEKNYIKSFGGDSIGRIIRAFEMDDIISGISKPISDITINAKYYFKKRSLSENGMHEISYFAEFLVDGKRELLVEMRRENNVSTSLGMHIIYIGELADKYAEKIKEFLIWNLNNINSARKKKEGKFVHFNKLLSSLNANQEDNILVRNLLQKMDFRKIGTEIDAVKIGKQKFSVEKWQLFLDINNCKTDMV